MSSSSRDNSTHSTPLHSSNFPTRTLAIIKSHALKHRLDVERRIVEAGFEIIKERQMQFDPDGDRETLIDLFGIDAASLSTEPVWVYVLERRRAVEVWNTLMGDPDPSLARIKSPNSLRAVYGVSLLDNAFIGSPDGVTADAQISALFASSPPFPSTEYPDDVDPLSLAAGGSVRSRASSEAPRSSNGRTSTTGFRARPLPATNAVPESQPRMTRAAALRINGVDAPPSAFVKAAPRALRTKEEQKQVFMDVPGHKRSTAIQVASTLAPALAPRPTRASALRENKDAAGGKTPSWGAPPLRRPPLEKKESGSVSFDGVPGHKRRESIQVASTAAPVIAPRPNRAAALRAIKEQAGGVAPPSSYMFRTPSNGTTPKINKRASFDAAALSSSGTSRATSALGTASATSVNNDDLAASKPRTLSRATSVIVVPSSIAKPDIVPRQNKSALLRAQKLAAAAKAK